MPEMRFRIRWPDGSRDSCYSPSLVIKDHLAPGEAYPVDSFVEKARQALTIASERVAARYGYPCSLALGQIRAIEAAAARQPRVPGAAVLVEAFEE